MTPTPMPPLGREGAIPKLPERLPLLQGQGSDLRTMLRAALVEKMSKKDEEVVCYLLRRAYGDGFVEGFKQRGDE